MKTLKVSNQPQIINVSIENIRIHNASIRNIHSEKNQEFIQFLVEQYQLGKTIETISCYANIDGTYTITDGTLRFECFKRLNLNKIQILVDSYVPKTNAEFIDIVLLKNLNSPTTNEEKLCHLQNVARIGSKEKSTNSKEQINNLISLIVGKGCRRNNAITFRMMMEFDYKNPNNLNLPLRILEGNISIDEGKKILETLQNPKYNYTLEREKKDKLISGIIEGRTNALKMQDMLIKQQEKTDYTNCNPISNFNKDRFMVKFCDSRTMKFPQKKMLDGSYSSIPYIYQVDNYSGHKSLMSTSEIGHEKSVDDYVGNVVSVYFNAIENFKDSAVIAINIADTYIDGVSLGIIPKIVVGMMNAGFHYLGQKIWVKKDAKPLSNKIKRDRDNYETILLFSVTKDYYFQKLKFENTLKTKQIKGNCSEQGTKNKKGFHVSNDYDTIDNFMEVQRFSDMIELNQAKSRSKMDFHGDFSFLLPLSFILQYIPEDGTIWDPFGGTGTVGRTSLLLNRKVIITELYEKNSEMIYNNLQKGGDEFNADRLEDLNDKFVEDFSLLEAV